MKPSCSIKFKVPFGDVDMMGHVNNARYFSYFENVRTEHLQKLFGDWQRAEYGIIIAHVEIDYKAPAGYRDELTVDIRVSSVGNSSWTYEYLVTKNSENRTIAIGKTVQVTYDYKEMRSIPIPQDFREKLLKDMKSTKD